MSGESGSGPQTSTVRCVLWHAAASQLPGELLTSLSQRVGRMIVCTDAYAALAEACLIERDRREARAAGQTPGSGVLLLVNPRGLDGVPEMIEAARTYAPGVARWCYEHSGNPRLRAIVESDIAAWFAQPKPVVVGRPVAKPVPRADVSPATQTAPSGQRPNGPSSFMGASTIAGPRISPKLRLTGVEDGANAEATNAGPDDGSRPRSGSQVRSRPILTEAELSMLLADDLPDERNGTHDQPGRGV